MASRYDAVATRKYTQNGEEKTAFTTIGVAFQFRDKEGYSLKLHAIPAPVDGEYTILLFPPKERDGQHRSDRPSSGGSGQPSFSSNVDDAIPF